MSDFPRYAIYYAPEPDTPLARFGAELLGYDAGSGADVLVPAEVITAAPDWPMLIKDPRKYGFHATLKAPFPLVDDKAEADLVAACADFASKPRKIPDITLEVRAISGFTAVIPADASADLNALAQDCVTAFEAFRAPMTAQDRARRKPELLTPRQVEHLDRFGYPYVGEDFRFHMTLTGRLPAGRTTPVLAMLQQRFAALALTSLRIDRIALFRQDDAATRFRVLQAFALTA